VVEAKLRAILHRRPDFKVHQYPPSKKKNGNQSVTSSGSISWSTSAATCVRRRRGRSRRASRPRRARRGATRSRRP
jgi:hypothetical protein